MKLLLINEVLGTGSTGKIVKGLAEEYLAKGWDVRVAYGRSGDIPKECQSYGIRIGSDFDVKRAALECRLLDNAGFSSRKVTEKFVEWAEAWQPDIVWMHNLHGYYINIEVLFTWLKRHPEIEKKWTLHDCWAFTGHCAYFTMADCDKWKTHCENCPQRGQYPKSLFRDDSSRNFDRKKAAFSGVLNLTLITPSQWLADLVGESFLKEYSVEVHYNSIDTDVFKPTPSDFRQRFHLEDKFVILGVANIWSERKGYDDFLKLAEMLDGRYRIVLVGLSEKQRKNLPANIIGLGRTGSQKELAEIYTTADVFVNPTYEDNFPTVNLEAEACGTPVITYDTGGCRETIRMEKSTVISVGNIEQLKKSAEKFFVV